ncbi:RNA polymerase sigma factor, sigma-70 family [Singulisphaera sp. GP187]|uniref:RNA polymerase sigma factor n=1 Tax=Singulisphaera sp. GP187 TaxID=1882752 RepID=UPI0009275BD5|nr:sigma-70 family RNA polymerase sigma factor [Singulisphaera sp. GP187]SIO65995.1 RNA polymerase sigma factor, sigma-70 family [Singulisphaera sp. GP187]
MGSTGVALGELTTLFQLGTVGDVDDSQLLERFLAGRDHASEAAFATLVERHGPMVMRLCLRRLGDSHDAQDAFQATFLVLVKRAHSIRNQKSVASWLFGVACRVTSRAKRDEARRSSKERRSVDISGPFKSVADPAETWPELYEEIDRLPERYRLPIVLHYLENLSYDQVAQQIGRPLRTVQTRLARGRERLRTRLIRRGLGTSFGLLIASHAKDGFTSETCRAFAWNVARTASRFTTGSVSHFASAKVVSMAYGVNRIMFMNKVASGAMLVLAMGGIGVGAVVFAQQGRGDKPATDQNQPKSSKAARTDFGEVGPVSVESKNRLIHKMLDEEIEADFENIPLGDLLKHIKKSSTGPNDNGIPIYVEPAGLSEAGQTMESPRSISVATKIKIRDLLTMALSHDGLSFAVKDGLLIIDSRTAIAQIRLEDRLDGLESKLDRILKAVEGRAKPPAQ